ncbi:hypothetical protein ACU8KH_03848 [Lachancea thermotolerans]
MRLPSLSACHRVIPSFRHNFLIKGTLKQCLLVFLESGAHDFGPSTTIPPKGSLALKSSNNLQVILV